MRVAAYVFIGIKAIKTGPNTTSASRKEPHWMMHNQTNQATKAEGRITVCVAAEVLDEERAGPLISWALIVFPTKNLIFQYPA